MLKLPASYLVDILRNEMGLTQNQVFLRNQNSVLPNDKRLYVSIGMVDSLPMSSRRKQVEDVETGALRERIIVNMRENHQIDVYSMDSSALTRRWEVIAAFESVYSQQVQELNGFRIFRLSSQFNNTSENIGAQQLTKFSIILPVFSWYEKEKVINSPLGDYYDDFDTRVDDENTIGEASGLIEFNIQGEVIT